MNEITKATCERLAERLPADEYPTAIRSIQTADEKQLKEIHHKLTRRLGVDNHQHKKQAVMHTR